MLTDAEKAACRAAPFKKGIGHGYGTPADGYCPIGAVAALRGAVFEVGPDGEYSAYSRNGWGVQVLSPYTPYIRGATEDVLGWTGYITLTSFLQALETDGAAVFPPEAARGTRL